MMSLHYGKLIPTTFAATTAQDGYPASNVGLESIARPWRATSAGANDVTILLPVAATIQTLFLHDVNFTAATIQKTVDGAAYVALGTLNTFADAHGRRRGYITVAVGQRGVKITPTGAPTDGRGYWNIGAAYFFGSVVNPAPGLRYGYRVRTRRPRVRAELTNRQIAVATTGLNVDVLNLTFERKNTELADDIIQRASAGACLFDIGLANYPHQQWPVRCPEEDLEEDFSNKNISTIPVPLMEVV